MKLTIGVLAVLLLVTFVAVAQNSQLPFPQAANPALASKQPAVVYQPVPPSMAANVGATVAETFAPRPSKIGTGSPFPMAANPATGAASFVEPSHEIGGSPFPVAANPAK